MTEYPNTIFKSAYWYGNQPIHLFLNYDVGGHKSFSLITKKGKFTLIHNIATSDKLKFARAVVKQLSEDELKLVLSDDSLNADAHISVDTQQIPATDDTTPVTVDDSSKVGN